MSLNWSSIISKTGWKFFHYTKERPMSRITRRMRRRDWWENTRYYKLRDILPSCVGVFSKPGSIEVSMSLPRVPSWFIPLIWKRMKTSTVRLPKESHQILQSKSWFECILSRSLNYWGHFFSCKVATWCLVKYRQAITKHSRFILSLWPPGH